MEQFMYPYKYNFGLSKKKKKKYYCYLFDKITYNTQICNYITD